MRLQNLTDIHAARHAERIEHDIDRLTVFQIGHVFHRHDAADDTLVAVASGHLVAGLKLALHGHENLDHLHDAGRKLVATLKLVDLVGKARFQALLAFVVLLLQRLDLGLRLLVGQRDLPPLAVAKLVEIGLRDLALAFDSLGPGSDLLAEKDFGKTAIDVAVENAEFVVAVFRETLDFLALDRHRALVLVDTVTVEHAHFDDRTGDTRRQAKRRIAHVRSLFAEDRAKQLLFRRHRAFALRRDLADENIAGVHFRADIDDAGFVEVLEGFFTDIRNVTRDFLRSELRVARHHLEFLDVDGGEHVIANDALGDEDGVLEVVAVPGHERDKHVAAKREIAEFGRRTVRDDIALLHLIAHTHQRTLIDAGVLVRALELTQIVDVDARLGRVDLFRRADNDTRRIHLIDDTRAASTDGSAGVTRHDFFHARAYERRLGTDERHGLTLHVRAHESAVRVVVFEERDERGRDGHDLLRRNVDEVHLIRRHHLEVAIDTAVHEFALDLALGAHFHIRLRDAVAAFFHGRKIDDLIGELAALHAPVRAFDKTVLVDAGKGCQRVDETDIRAFRRFDRADAAVMGRVHVAHFEARTLARKTARPKRRKTALMRDFRKRVRLVHELRELRGTEELANGGSRRLRVDQVVRHDRVDIDGGHALLDRAFHAKQADAVLVLHEFADRTHAAVAEIVDIVDLALAVAKADKRLDDRENIFLAEHTDGIRRIEVETHVHLHAANRGKIVAFGVEEEAVEERFGRIRRRRLARAHHAIDIDQSLLAVRALVDGERVANEGARVHMVDVERDDLVMPRLDKLLQQLRRDLVARLGEDFAGFHVDDFLRQIAAMEVLVLHEQFLEAILGELLGKTRRDLAARLHDRLARLRVDEVALRLHAAITVGVERHTPALLHLGEGNAVVEGRENFLGVEAERIKQRRHRQLAAAVDTHIDDVFCVELEVEPGTAIGNDARGEEQLARRMGFTLVMIEEHAGAAMHLRNDDALGAVDHEGAVLGHERHVAHVDVLLLDVLDGLGAGVFVDFEHDEPERHLERRRKGHSALLAFLDVILRRFELVVHEFERGRFGKVADRENRFEDGIEPLLFTSAFRLLNLQELVV